MKRLHAVASLTSPSLRDTSPASWEARSGRNISAFERKWELFWGVILRRCWQLCRTFCTIWLPRKLSNELLQMISES